MSMLLLRSRLDNSASNENEMAIIGVPTLNSTSIISSFGSCNFH